MTDYRSEIAAKAEAALDEKEAPGEEGEDGTATVEEKVDPTKPKDDSAAADEGDSSDESDEGEEDKEDAVADDEEDSESDEDEEDSEDNDEDEDFDDEEEVEKPKSRSQERIKQLIREKKLSEDENAVLKAQLQAKDGTPAEKAAADKALRDKGYTPEQIAEGKKFLAELGLDPAQVSEMQKKLQKAEDDKLISEDRAELRDALSKSKSELTEKDVMKYVQKWATSKDPKIQARASLDYRTIIKLIAGKKATEKVVDETLKAKKKVAPKIPAGGGGTVIQKDEADTERWNPGDRRGSMDRLLEKATKAMDAE